MTAPSYGTTRRTIRVSDELWDAALAAAEARGKSLSEDIRELLEQYVKDWSN